jgi:hypothetical protein
MYKDGIETKESKDEEKMVSFRQGWVPTSYKGWKVYVKPDGSWVTVDNKDKTVFSGPESKVKAYIDKYLYKDANGQCDICGKTPASSFGGNTLCDAHKAIFKEQGMVKDLMPLELILKKTKDAATVEMARRMLIEAKSLGEKAEKTNKKSDYKAAMDAFTKLRYDVVLMLNLTSKEWSEVGQPSIDGMQKYAAKWVMAD